MKAILIRFSEEKQTLGNLQLFENEQRVFECKTMELPWLNNQRRISCIPVGEYKVKKHVSPMFGNCFYVENVPDRSEILIHKGNYNSDTLGCILPGAAFADINKDGLKDVTSSVATMKQLLAIAPDEFTLTILE